MEPVEVGSWHEGTVLDLIARPGETLPVGAVIATLLAPGEKAAAARKPVSPAARKHARELGVDVESLAGSGPHGVATLADLERAAAQRPALRRDRLAPARSCRRPGRG